MVDETTVEEQSEVAESEELPNEELLGRLMVTFNRNGTIGMNFEGALSPTLLWGAAELLRLWGEDVHRAHQMQQAQQAQQQADRLRRLTQ